MRQIISIYIIQQLLYFTSKVASLTGPKVTKACNREFTFIASLQYYPKAEHFCSGALITGKHVVTAAHCLVGKHQSGVRVVLGVVDLKTSTAHYGVASWLTYDVWASGLRLREAKNFHDIAIVTVQLTGEASQTKTIPIRLSGLNKQQVQGKKAIVIGWNDREVLQKGIVKVLSDADCERNRHLVTNYNRGSHPKTLCTYATPYVLLQNGDSGGPLLDEFGALLGVNHGYAPRTNNSWSNFSEEFLQQYQVNMHLIIDYYRYFIVNATGYR